MKKIFGFMVALVVTITLLGCQNNDNDRTLTVGLECVYPPFNWTETTKSATNHPIANLPGGYAEGYDIQIAKLLADALDYELVVKMIAWEGLIPALTSGEIDVIIAGMSPTEERKETIDFTDAYYTSNHVLVVKADSIYANATTLADLSGAVGVGQAGTVYADLVDSMVTEFGCTKIVNRETAPLCINNILFDEADFTIFEKPVALGYVEKDSRLTMLFGDADNIFGLSAEDRDVSIGIKKDAQELKEAINTVLATINTTTREEMMAAAVTSNN